MPIYPVKNNRTGKTYDMPWDGEDPPTSIDAMQYIDKIEHPDLMTRTKNITTEGLSKAGDLAGKAWDTVNAPLTDLPSRASKYVGEPLLNYGMNNTGLMAKAARGAGAFTESLGDVTSSLTSPLSLGLAAATGGSSIAGRAGLAKTAQALAAPGRVAAAGMIGHGGYNALRPGSTLPERLGGITEAGLGALGVRGPEVQPKPDFSGVASKPFGPEMPEMGLGKPKGPDFTNPNWPRSDMPIREGQYTDVTPAETRGIGPYEQPRLPPAPDQPSPGQLGLPPKKPTYYGGPAGGSLSTDIDAAPSRVFAGGQGATPPGRMPARSFSQAQGLLRESPPLRDATPTGGIRDILEQNSPYGRIVRGAEPPAASPQFTAPKSVLPDLTAGPQTSSVVDPRTPVSEAAPAPKPVAKAKAPDVTPSPSAATASRPYAKVADSDIEFLAKTGDKAALDEARLRPSMKETLGYLFKQAPDVSEVKTPVGGAAASLPDIAQDVSGKPVRPPIDKAKIKSQLADLGMDENFINRVIENSPNVQEDLRNTPNIADVKAAAKPIETPTETPSPTTPPKLKKGQREDGIQIKKGSDFSYDGNWDVELPNGHKTQIFYDKASQTWYENKPTTKQHTSHYSDNWGFSKDELLGKLNKAYGADVTTPVKETTPALDTRSITQKVKDVAKKMVQDESGSLTLGRSPEDEALYKANKQKAMDWATRREAANHHGDYARSDFKDLIDQPDLIDKFQAGDRSGRLADVQAHFDKLYQDEVDAGIFSGKKMSKENYLRQTYKPELVDEESSAAVKGGTVPKTPAFAKKSTYATFAEARAAGHEPLYDNLADIIGARTVESKRAIANKQFDTYLNETAQKSPEMTIKEPTQLRFEGPMHKQLGTYTNNVLSDSPDWLHNIAKGVATTKNIYLAGGIPYTPLNIHGYNIARSRYMASGVKGIGDFTKGIFNPAGDVAYLKSERPLIQKAIDYGYQMTSEENNPGAFAKLLDKSKIGKAVNWGMDKTKELFEDPLFKVSLPANKARVLRENYDRLLPKVGEEQALRQASTIANDFMGGINKSLRGKTAQDLLQIGILAPDWAESRINLGVKGLKAMAGKEDPIYAKALARGGVMRGAGAAAQMGIGEQRGDKPSDLTSVGLGRTDSGKFREAPILGTAAEILRMPEEIGRGALQGDFRPAARLLRNRVSQPAQSFLNTFYSGTDAFGNPLSGKDKYNRQIPASTAAANYAQELTASFQPQQAQAAFNYLRGKQGGEETIAQSLELPLKYSTPPKGGPARRQRSRTRTR